MMDPLIAMLFPPLLWIGYSLSCIHDLLKQRKDRQ